MDIQQLVGAITASTNPDPTIRKAGEDALKQVRQPIFQHFSISISLGIVRPILVKSACFNLTILILHLSAATSGAGRPCDALTGRRGGVDGAISAAGGCNHL